MTHKFYEYATPWVLDAEGGFVNDAADHGGATKYGISLRYLKNVPDHDGDGFVDGDFDHDGDVDIDDIRAMDKADALHRYRQDFWLDGGCDRIPGPLGLCLFDGLVNHRPRTARLLLQRALGVKADGIIGPASRYSANHCDIDRVLLNYFSYRGKFYHAIVVRDPTQEKFIRGWLRRLFKLQAYIFDQEHASCSDDRRGK